MLNHKWTNGKWLHTALGIIVLGACVTHFFGEQGEIHLRADKAETIRLQRQSVLPFDRGQEGSNQRQITLFLWDFQVLSDQQGNPVDYITALRLLDRGSGNNPSATANGQLPVGEGTIRMNKPLKYHGWRFCQSDYDSDQMGVVLAYNYDPWGIAITYTGYALLLMAMIGFFFQKNTRFRMLLKKQHVWLMTGLGVMAVVLAIIMTKVVTPKPPLQPVLQTPLLGIHVSVIMLAYTLFAVIAILGIVGLCSKKMSTVNYQLSTILLYPAEFCLTAGIFIGAVWANMSWGRYWGWDPKETWALITMLVYAALLHWPVIIRSVTRRATTPSADSPANTSPAGYTANERAAKLFHIFSIVAFFFVLFTYFGVSYLLGGLHSYA